MKKQSIAELGIVACAFFWGISGLLTQVAIREVSPFNLTFLRFAIAAFFSIIIFKVNPFKIDKITLKHSLNLSLLLFIIYISSTYGLRYTSASNAGFIIGSTVFLVPIINLFIFKFFLTRKEILCVLASLIGLALVTLKGSKTINVGDFLCFVDAIAYSVYIIYNSRLSCDSNPFKIASMQFIFVTIFSFIYIITFEILIIPTTTASIISILVLGLFCTFAAFIIQNIAQRYTSATRVSTLLTLMPVFTVLFDYIFVNIRLSKFALVGGLLIVLSTSYMSSPSHKFYKSKITIPNRN